MLRRSSVAMSNIKLYYSPGACSLAPHILLREADAKAEIIKLSVKKGFPEDHRDLNPKLRVPILVLNGDTITENPAIMTAIAQLAPGKHLMGETDLEKVRVYEYMNYLSSSVHTQAWGQILRPHRYSDDEAAYAGIKAKGFKNLIQSLDYVESTLKGVHAVGAKFTAVDAYLYVFYRWASSAGIDMAAKYPKYSSLVVELLSRKSVQEALKAEEVPSFAPNL
ncbi:hypothetical protein DV737_g4821, partial [Chaetothyriales sp. CBS 132003]